MPTKADANDTVTDDVTNDTIAADAPAEDAVATEPAPDDAQPEQAPADPAPAVEPPADDPAAPVESIPVGLAAAAQVTLPVDPPAPTPLPTVDVYVESAGSRIITLHASQKLEVFDGDAWTELTERRPDGVKMRGYRSPGGVPEGYVRADDEYVMLWPTLADDTLFRVTSQD